MCSYCESLHTVFFAHGRQQWTDASLLSTQTMTFDLKIEHFLGIFLSSFKQGQVLSGQQRMQFLSLHLRLSHTPAVLLTTPAVPLPFSVFVGYFVITFSGSICNKIYYDVSFGIFRVHRINYY